MIQLELFHQYSETEMIQMQCIELKKSQDKLRKALFARNGNIEKKFIELQDRLEIIERNICTPNKSLEIFKFE